MLGAAAHAATVSYIQTSVNDAGGATIGAVSSNQYLETGVSYSTVTAPASFSSYRFTHWTNSSYPATIYRDAWGRSLNPISFILLEDTTATAHYLPATRDIDGDGVPDWYEMEYFGNLANPASFDGDGDGISLLAEYRGGTHPLYGNSSQEGGVACGLGLGDVQFAGYPTYTLRSEPAGTVNQSAICAAGHGHHTPSLAAKRPSATGRWTACGSRIRGAWPCRRSASRWAR